MRPRKPSRRLHDQNRRLRFRIQRMAAEIMQAIECLADQAESDQGANQATRHLRSALSGEPCPPTRGTACGRDHGEVF